MQNRPKWWDLAESWKGWKDGDESPEWVYYAFWSASKLDWEVFDGCPLEYCDGKIGVSCETVLDALEELRCVLKRDVEGAKERQPTISPRVLFVLEFAVQKGLNEEEKLAILKFHEGIDVKVETHWTEVKPEVFIDWTDDSSDD